MKYKGIFQSLQELIVEVAEVAEVAVFAAVVISVELSVVEPDCFFDRRGEFGAMPRLSSSGAPQIEIDGSVYLVNITLLVLGVVFENVRCKSLV
jgi:hypothetical protein